MKFVLDDSGTTYLKMARTYKINSDFRCLCMLLYMCKILGVAPSYNKQKNRFVETKFQKIYAVILLAVAALSYLIPLDTRIYWQRYLPQTVFILTNYSMTSLCLLFVTALTSANFYNSRRYENLLNNFLKLDKKIRYFKVIKEESNFYYYCEILILQGLNVFCLIAAVEVFFFNFKLMNIKVYMFEYVLRFSACTLALLMSNLISCIKYRFESVNKIILNFSLKYIRKISTLDSCEVVLIQNKLCPVKYLERTTQIYLMLKEQVEHFNEIFGWILFFLTMEFLSAGLLMLHVVIRGNQEYGGIQYLFLAVIFTYLLILATISFSANGAVTEANKIGELCYIILQKISCVCESSQQRQVKHLLRVLGRQATLKRPQFTAGGVFKIDCTWLLNVLQLTVSYFIVVLIASNETQQKSKY